MNRREDSIFSPPSLALDDSRVGDNPILALDRWFSFVKFYVADFQALAEWYLK
jgi:hypothetical protein